MIRRPKFTTTEISVATLNSIKETVEKLDNIKVGNGLNLVKNSAGYFLSGSGGGNGLFRGILTSALSVAEPGTMYLQTFDGSDWQDGGEVDVRAGVPFSGSIPSGTIIWCAISEGYYFGLITACS